MADYSALLTTLDTAVLCTEADFGTSNYKAFASALEQAVLLANDATATQSLINAAQKELEGLLNGLTITVSYTDLNVMTPSLQLGVGKEMPLLVVGIPDRGITTVLPANNLTVVCTNGHLSYKNGILTALSAGEETIRVTAHGVTKELQVLVTEN